MELITTANAPAAIGPYSQAVKIGELIFTSGQIALKPDGDESVLLQDVEAQTHQVLTNLRHVLQAAGADLGNVVKTTIFLANMEDFSKVNAIYESYFGIHKPARSTVAVKSLPKGALVEIDAIAKV
ncbi:RidA family protein [Nitratiruptor tergarcus]|uniref:2-iminobutanoate/2-iminopropanoate deaminase n=1 Tax=Nitratiruptor tergarcus DSM 16512 TaxID=1069081 RepID=A0A1W1WW40_9BACT|nr:RidA family protein [Nitratiruptor tergarcus]SMC09953.1 2-iminobutanoate/2-iminopropanoate deaminase [Nitratiruptor tergarcus DSM 16512]